MIKITDINQLDFNKQYTYADYLTWQFQERVELIKRWLYKMPALPSSISPAPRRIHQEIKGSIYFEICKFTNLKTCKIYQFSFDVRLKRNKDGQNEINAVLQPDICVICDETKRDDAGCEGDPDLMIEILSDSIAKINYNEKFNLYEENGVKEYWIVNPASRNIELFSLSDGCYVSLGLFDESEGVETVHGNLFPELEIELKTIFKT